MGKRVLLFLVTLASVSAIEEVSLRSRKALIYTQGGDKQRLSTTVVQTLNKTSSASKLFFSYLLCLCCLLPYKGSLAKCF